jgi:hypothetical protein
MILTILLITIIAVIQRIIKSKVPVIEVKE